LFQNTGKKSWKKNFQEINKKMKKPGGQK
jgi:hypothetical protein